MEKTMHAPRLVAGRADQDGDLYDIVAIGGALAGAAFTLLLRRWVPGARVLIVERNAFFHRKVGEATVEISGCFFHRVLGLFDHLSREQLPKHGLRYWFADHPGRSLFEMSEVGPRELPRLASFQLDRAKLDQHLLDTARAEGAEVMRPARVVDVELGWPESKVTIEGEQGRRTVRARWVLDASGRQTVISRKLKLYQKVEEHPTAAVWARFEGVKDMDGAQVLGGDPRRARLQSIGPARRLATNHFCDYGWWCWVIPLSSGQTSIGLVYNKELYEPPGEGTVRDRFLAFLASRPGLRELTADAKIVEEEWGEDFMQLSHLPYRTSQYMDKGWALVGDAASFMDPYYSPGMDHAAMSIFATARLIQQDLEGRACEETLGKEVARHNAAFTRSYERWLDALYIGKYELMGDADLLGAAFLMDTALYYTGVVTPVQRNLEAIANPAFGIDLPQATWAYKLMKGINSRLQKLARLRRAAGTYGRNNVGLHRYSRAFGVGLRKNLPGLLKGFRIWMTVELECLGHRLRHGRVDTSAPVEAPAKMKMTASPDPA
jgi:flavin-dependent dehydrogenase